MKRRDVSHEEVLWIPHILEAGLVEPMFLHADGVCHHPRETLCQCMKGRMELRRNCRGHVLPSKYLRRADPTSINAVIIGAHGTGKCATQRAFIQVIGGVSAGIGDDHVSKLTVEISSEYFIKEVEMRVVSMQQNSLLGVEGDGVTSSPPSRATLCHGDGITAENLPSNELRSDSPTSPSAGTMCAGHVCTLRSADVILLIDDALEEIINSSCFPSIGGCLRSPYSLPRTLSAIRRYSNPDIPIILGGNKSDQRKRSAADVACIRKACLHYGLMGFVEYSATTHHGIRELYDLMIHSSLFEPQRKGKNRCTIQ